MEQQISVQKQGYTGADSFFLHMKQGWLLFSRIGASHLSAWMILNRNTYPGFIFRAGIVAVGLVLATISISAIHTGFGEIVEDIIMQAGVAVLLISLLCVMLIMSRGTYLSFEHVRETWSENAEPKGTKELSPGTGWTPPSIGIDTLICLLPGETLSAFAERAKAESAKTTHAIWCVYIPPFQNQAAIFTFEKSTDFFFSRGDEPFNAIIEEKFRLPAGIDHVNETIEQYQKYVDWFAPIYRQWVDTGVKLEINKGRAQSTIFEILEGHAKIVSTLCLALLFCFPAFGQSKIRQVSEVLGTRMREIPEAGEKVTFTFHEGSKDKLYIRTGDGVNNYPALLQKSSGIIRYDDNGGQIVSIQKGGEVIARGPQVERVNEQLPTASTRQAPNGYATESQTGDPVRPRGALTASDVTNTPAMDGRTLNFPDSSQSVQLFEGLKDDIRQVEDKTGRVAKPAFDFSWWLFGEIFVGLFALASVLWFFAKTASEEGIIGVWGETIFISSFLVTVHQNCSAMLMCVLWAGESFIFLKGAQLLLTAPLPLIFSCVLWLVGLKLMRKTHNMIVPNIKGVAQGGATGRNINRGVTPY